MFTLKLPHLPNTQNRKLLHALLYYKMRVPSQAALLFLEDNPSFTESPPHSAERRLLLNAVDADGRTPLLAALADESLQAVARALLALPDVDVAGVTDRDGHTAAHLVARHHRSDPKAAVDMLRLLASRGADLSAPDRLGTPPLLFATSRAVAAHLLQATNAPHAGLLKLAREKDATGATLHALLLAGVDPAEPWDVPSSTPNNRQCSSAWHAAASDLSFSRQIQPLTLLQAIVDAVSAAAPQLPPRALRGVRPAHQGPLLSDEILSLRDAQGQTLLHSCASDLAAWRAVAVIDLLLRNRAVSLTDGARLRGIPLWAAVQAFRRSALEATDARGLRPLEAALLAKNRRVAEAFVACGAMPVGTRTVLEHLPTLLSCGRQALAGGAVAQSPECACVG